MSDLLEYKGYHGTVEYSAEDGILCTKTNYWSESKTYTGSFLMPEKEVKKMEEHGICCF